MVLKIGYFNQENMQKIQPSKGNIKNYYDSNEDFIVETYPHDYQQKQVALLVVAI